MGWRPPFWTAVGCAMFGTADAMHAFITGRLVWWAAALVMAACVGLNYRNLTNTIEGRNS